MTKTTFLLSCFSLLTLGHLSAQQNNYFQSLTQNMTAVAQSPNAAELGKYGEYPVNESTGTPNIQIPIYNVSVGNISFPISLSYHGSGIKVSEQTSWVGAGFSLDAGGVVTRRVQGLADDAVVGAGNAGYFYNYQTINNVTSGIEINDAQQQGLPFMDFKMAIDEGRYDFMPDLFSYNFAGRSGTFTLLPEGQQNNEMQLKAILTPNDDIKVEASLPLPGKLTSFKVTDDNGLIYLFNKIEKNLDNLSTTNPSPAPTYDASVNTAWYLGSISDPKTGSTVSFSYEVDTLETDKIWDFQKTIAKPGAVSYCSLSPQVSRDAYSRILSLRLKSINYENTRIDFNAATTNRLDVLGTKALDNVSVYKNNNLVQKTLLATDYFTAATGMGNTAKRLKLEKVQQLDPSNNQVIGEYTFDYNSTPLPARNDTLQDLWGYYRIGAIKFPVKEELLLQGSNGGPSTFQYNYSSESRMPGTETIAGTLSKITYPTGGYTNFNFENNRYWVNEPVYQVISRTNATNANTVNYATPITTPFTITTTTRFHFSSFFSPSIIHYSSSGNPQGPCPYAGSAVLYKNGTFGAILSFAEEMDFDIELDPGTYHFESTIQQDTCTTAMVRVNSKEYKVIGYNHSKIGPGLRIASIENYDQYSNKTQTTAYTYETDSAGHSSGILFSYPDVIKEWTMKCEQETLDPLRPTIIQYSDYYTFQFNDLVNSGGVIGSPIYYRQVSKKITGAANGKIVNTYRNQGLPMVVPQGLPAFFMSESYKNGQLAGTKTFDENGVLKQQKNYTNSFPAATSSYGVYAFKTTTNAMASGSDFIRLIKYEIKSASVQVAQEVNKEYLNGQEMVTTTNYTYNTPEQKSPSTITTIFNDGTKEISNFKYARDFSLPATGTLSGELQGIKSLQDNRIYNVPLELYQTTSDEDGEKVTAGNYMEVASNPIGAPKNIYSLKLSDAIDDYSPATVNGTQIDKDSRYTKDLGVLSYSAGSPTSYTVNDQLFSKTYHNPRLGQISTVVAGADIATVSATSFENASTDAWTGSGISYQSSGLTGTSACNLGSGSLTKSGLNTATPYRVSFWAQGAANVYANGTLLSSTNPAINGWKLYEYDFQNSQLQLTGTGIIDELRLMPIAATLQTVTYNSKAQITSVCDDKNNISYYEYDALGRLIRVKDLNGNLLKTHEYQFQSTN
ncbi:hypothetical protein DBR32_10430 [Taibaiella sp. KBW10]|uniref:hypothetical protein n=1 Tax=Taibaiella sp. KBW10 TaxID=2153357 RepID=UPI000F5B832D|nr:hypothetical protein [Taibaiella sp. KBW10]RQO31111.1 hypothetical protein DBR32_10430 [Taibaiella sp. KBW10]